MAGELADQVTEQLKKVTSMRARRKLALTRVGVRSVTAGLRTLPDFLIIGAQRSGTSSLYKYLGQHPNIVPSLRKEVDYFSGSHGRGQAWYRSHFPTTLRRKQAARKGEPLLTFEATPFYLVDPHAPARAAREIPDARIIAMLRNPTDRAFSHHGHNRRLDHEPLEFDEAIAAEPERLEGEFERLLGDPSYRAFNLRRYGYAFRGHYARQLARWYEHFPPDRILVVQSEDFYTDTPAVYKAVLEFLGLPEWQPAAYRNFSYVGAPAEAPSAAAAMTASTRQMLDEEFAPSNAALEEMLGRRFSWTS